MKVVYKINDSTTLEQECPSVKTAFRFLAYAQEVFGPRKCPQSSATQHKLKFRVAQTKDGKKCEYYSLECPETGWEFKFGQKQDEGQTLFPKGWEPPYQADKSDKSETPSNGQSRQHQPSDYDHGRVPVGAGVGDDMAF